MAIESDGTEQYRSMSVRERSRLRPQLLERLGWRYMPLWTIEVFTDPSACADRIGGYLGLEKPARPVRSAAGPGFLDDDVTSLAGSYEPSADQEPYRQDPDQDYVDDEDRDDDDRGGVDTPDQDEVENGAENDYDGDTEDRQERAQ